MAKKNTSKGFPKIQKDLKSFLESEEGKIVEKDAIKIGTAVIVAGSLLSGVITSLDNAYAQGECVHNSHASHASHASHGSHSRGGWC